MGLRLGTVLELLIARSEENYAFAVFMVKALELNFLVPLSISL